MPDGAAGGSPWAADGPAGAWWRGDPAAAAARFAALDRPAVPPVPPAPIVTMPAPPDAALSAGEAIREAPGEAEVVRPEARAVREPTPTRLRPAVPADGFDPAPEATSRQPESEPADTAVPAPAGHGESPEQAGEQRGPDEPSLDGVEAATGDSVPEHDAERAAAGAGASDDRATDDTAPALEAPASLTDAEPDEAPPIDGAAPAEIALDSDDTPPEEATSTNDRDPADIALDSDDTPLDGTGAPDDQAPAEVAARDETTPEDAAVVEGVPADMPGGPASEAAVPAQMATTRVDRHASIARLPAGRGGAETQVAGAEPATHTQETVVLPPMPERALIPTPSPAPDGDELPFWLPTHEVPRRDRYSGRRPGRLPKPPRSPAVGLVGLVVLALLATFFAWVSAEPLWLAVGHGDSGTATISECTGSGVGQRCVGEFSAANGAFTAEGIRLVGVADGESTAGSTVTARMVGADSGRAYVGDAAAVRHLRWALGLVLVVLCGFGLVWVTGARRLEDRWSRRTATVTALAAPLLVTVAFLASTF